MAVLYEQPYPKWHNRSRNEFKMRYAEMLKSPRRSRDKFFATKDLITDCTDYTGKKQKIKFGYGYAIRFGCVFRLSYLIFKEHRRQAKA